MPTQEAFLTHRQMLDKVEDFITKYEANKDSPDLPSGLEETISSVYAFQSVLEDGVSLNYTPNEEIATKFGMVALLMDLIETTYFTN
jgi:hypothetical protein